MPLRGLELAHPEERVCQSAVGLRQEDRVILLQRQRVKSLGNLHRGRQPVGDEGMHAAAQEGQVQERRTVKRLTQGLRTFVTKARLGSGVPSRER